MNAASSSIDKFKNVISHFASESKAIDEDELFNFDPIFEEFLEILGAIVREGESSKHGNSSRSRESEQLCELHNFLEGLFDSVKKYIRRKKELEKVQGVETLDFLEKLSTTYQSIGYSIRELEKTVGALLCQKEKEKTVKRSATPASIEQLRKSLGSSRDKREESSQEDATSGATTERRVTSPSREKDLRRENNELMLQNEMLKHELEILQEEVHKGREGWKDNLRLFELQVKRFDVKLSGHSKTIEERLGLFEDRVSILDALVEQKSAAAKGQAARGQSAKQACEALVKTLTDKVEGLETRQFSLQLELQKCQMEKRSLEKENDFLKKALATAEKTPSVSPIGESNDKLKAELEALKKTKSDLETKIGVINKAREEMNEQVEQMKAQYSKEITELRIQLNGLNKLTSKSRFCSTTNMKEGKKEKVEPIPEKVERESFQGKAWDDIKNIIHKKADARYQNSVPKSSNPASKKNSESSNSDHMEQEIASDSSSDSRNKGARSVNIKIKDSKPKDMKMAQVTLPRSTQTLPANNTISPLNPPVGRSAHSRGGNQDTAFKEKYLESVAQHEKSLEECALLQHKIKKKEEHASALRKEAVAWKNEAEKAKQDKLAMRENLVEKERQLVIALSNIEDLKNSLKKEETERIRLEGVVVEKDRMILSLKENKGSNEEDKKQIAKYEAKIATMKTKQEELEEEVHRLQGLASKVEAYQSKSRKDLEEISHLKKSLESIKQEVNSKDHQLIILQCSLKEHQDALNETKKHSENTSRSKETRDDPSSTAAGQKKQLTNLLQKPSNP